MATDPKNLLTGADEDGQQDETKDDVTIVETDNKGKPLVAEDAGDKGGEEEGDERVSADTREDDRGGEPRRRETHAERRERHKRARERDQREMNFLRIHNQKLEERIDQLAKATTAGQAQTIDDRLAEALREVETAERVHAAAISAGNGEDAVAALRLRDEARDKALTLHHERERLKNQPIVQPAMPAYAPVAQKFGELNPWFTWDDSNEDSKTVLQIDAKVMQEGYNPNTPAYWQELDRRVRAALPHRYRSGSGSREEDGEDGEEDDVPDTRTRRGPPVGTGRTHVPNSTRREAYISPERKAAMIEAGVWDDPVLRKKYAKAYSEWDRNNSARR